MDKEWGTSAPSQVSGEHVQRPSQRSELHPNHTDFLDAQAKVNGWGLIENLGGEVDPLNWEKRVANWPADESSGWAET